MNFALDGKAILNGVSFYAANRIQSGTSARNRLIPNSNLYFYTRNEEMKRVYVVRERVAYAFGLISRI